MTEEREDPHKPVAKEIKRLRQLGDYGDAIALAKPYLAEHPDAVRVWCSLAATHQAAGNMAEALSIYKYATENFPDEGVTFSGYANALLASGRKEEAAAAFAISVKILPNSATTFGAYAQTLFDIGRKEKSLDVFRSAIENFPEHTAVYNAYAQALLGMRRTEEALAIYRMTTEVFCDNPVSLCGYANALLVSGRPEAAIEVYRNAIARFPKENIAYGGLANSLLVSGDKNAAIAVYAEAAAKFPQDAWLRNGYAHALLMDNQHAPAKNYLLSVNHEQPLDIVGCMVLAIAASKDRDQSALDKAFNLACAQPPDMHVFQCLYSIARLGVDTDKYSRVMEIAVVTGELSPDARERLRIHETAPDVESEFYLQRTQKEIERATARVSSIYHSTIPREPIDRVAVRVCDFNKAAIEKSTYRRRRNANPDIVQAGWQR